MDHRNVIMEILYHSMFLISSLQSCHFWQDFDDDFEVIIYFPMISINNCRRVLFIFGYSADWPDLKVLHINQKEM